MYSAAESMVYDIRYRGLERANSLLTDLARAVKSSAPDERVQGQWSTLGKTFMTVGTGAAALGISFLRMGGQLQQSVVTLKAFTGSAQEASNVIAQLQKFSLETPFQYRQWEQSTRSLLAFGIQAKDLERTLRAVGDTAAAVGADVTFVADAIAQIKVGHIGIGLSTLRSYGIPTPMVQQQMMKMGYQGDVYSAPAQLATEATTAVMQRKFGGLMEDLMGTFPQTMSNLADAANILQQKWGKLTTEAVTPLIQSLTGILASVGNWDDSLKSAVLRIGGASAAALALGGAFAYGRLQWLITTAEVVQANERLAASANMAAGATAAAPRRSLDAMMGIRPGSPMATGGGVTPGFWARNVPSWTGALSHPVSPEAATMFTSFGMGAGIGVGSLAGFGVGAGMAGGGLKHDIEVATLALEVSRRKGTEKQIEANTKALEDLNKRLDAAKGTGGMVGGLTGSVLGGAAGYGLGALTAANPMAGIVAGAGVLGLGFAASAIQQSNASVKSTWGEYYGSTTDAMERARGRQAAVSGKSMAQAAEEELARARAEVEAAKAEAHWIPVPNVAGGPTTGRPSYMTDASAMARIEAALDALAKAEAGVLAAPGGWLEGTVFGRGFVTPERTAAEKAGRVPMGSESGYGGGWLRTPGAAMKHRADRAGTSPGFGLQDLLASGTRMDYLQESYANYQDVLRSQYGGDEEKFFATFGGRDTPGGKRVQDMLDMEDAARRTLNQEYEKNIMLGEQALDPQGRGLEYALEEAQKYEASLAEQNKALQEQVNLGSASSFLQDRIKLNEIEQQRAQNLLKIRDLQQAVVEQMQTQLAFAEAMSRYSWGPQFAAPQGQGLAGGEGYFTRMAGGERLNLWKAQTQSLLAEEQLNYAETLPQGSRQRAAAETRALTTGAQAQQMEYDAQSALYRVERERYDILEKQGVSFDDQGKKVVELYENSKKIAEETGYTQASLENMDAAWERMVRHAERYYALSEAWDAARVARGLIIAGGDDQLNPTGAGYGIAANAPQRMSAEGAYLDRQILRTRQERATLLEMKAIQPGGERDAQLEQKLNDLLSKRQELRTQEAMTLFGIERSQIAIVDSQLKLTRAEAEKGAETAFGVGGIGGRYARGMISLGGAREMVTAELGTLDRRLKVAEQEAEILRQRDDPAYWDKSAEVNGIRADLVGKETELVINQREVWLTQMQRREDVLQLGDSRIAMMKAWAQAVGGQGVPAMFMVRQQVLPLLQGQMREAWSQAQEYGRQGDPEKATRKATEAYGYMAEIRRYRNPLADAASSFFGEKGPSGVDRTMRAITARIGGARMIQDKGIKVIGELRLSLPENLSLADPDFLQQVTVAAARGMIDAFGMNPVSQ